MSAQTAIFFVKIYTVSESELNRTGFEFKMGILVIAATVVLLSLLAPSISQEVNTTLPLTYRARAAEGGEQVCSPDDLQQCLQAVIHNDIFNLLRNNLPALVRCSDRNLGQLEHCPAASYSDIEAWSQIYVPLATTGSNGTAVQVYCDMDRVCGCNSTGGWTRVAYLNMTDPSQQCLSAWTLQTCSSEPRRLCELESWKTIHLDIQLLLVHVLIMLQYYTLSPLLWRMTTFVRVETKGHDIATQFMKLIHSGMVRVVEPPPAVS